jgi:hypothetical protein
LLFSLAGVMIPTSLAINLRHVFSIFAETVGVTATSRAGFQVAAANFVRLANENTLRRQETRWQSERLF